MIWAAMAFLLGVFVGYWIGTFKTVAEVNKAVDAVRRSYPFESSAGHPDRHYFEDNGRSEP